MQDWPENEYTSPWVRNKLTTLVVIGTYCTGSCKSNYHIWSWPPRAQNITSSPHACQIKNKGKYSTRGTVCWASPLNPLCQMNWNLVWSIYGRSSIKIAHFVTIRWQTWPPQAIIVSDWSISKNSSLKPLGQMDQNLVGSIYKRSSINIANFVLIR
jgi:hypothetical protein